MIGLILFAYGAPESMDQLKDYYTHIRYGKEPSEQDLQKAIERFQRAGTAESLGTITKRQAASLKDLLQDLLDEEVRAYTAYKHTPPFVEDTVNQMVRDGVSKIVTLLITPLESRTGSMLYQLKVRQTLEQLNVSIPIIHVDQWHLHPRYLEVLADRVRSAVQWLPSSIRQESTVVFTAHSQPGKPERHITYTTQFAELAEAIANRLELPHWRTAYRSAGEKGEWIGPDVKEIIHEEADAGRKGIVTCDLLSMTSNVEALEDIGYDLRPLCDERGMLLVRSEFLNDAYDFMKALSHIVGQRIPDTWKKVHYEREGDFA